MKKIIIHILFLCSLGFMQDEQLSNYHISLSLHENLINDFFANMGVIEGKGETAIGSYNWKLVEPRIDIEEDTILFFSKVRLSVGELKTYKDVKGWVSATYNQEINKVILRSHGWNNGLKIAIGAKDSIYSVVKVKNLIILNGSI